MATRCSVPKHAANQDFSPDRAEASTARPIKSIGAWMIHQMKTEQFFMDNDDYP